MMHQNHTVDRFYSLDALRGLAALSVVFWHWKHFFYVGTHLGTFNANRLPLFQSASLMYTKTWLAVDLFFCLSGFIFYAFYSQRISTGALTFGRFAALRLSRLYPLHFATLMLVAAGQAYAYHCSGHFVVYPHNDAKHFILNLFFASSWGAESGYSYNGPVWSVSIEILLYSIFFFLSRHAPIRAQVLVPLSISGFIVWQPIYEPIGRGVGSFFLGGCVCLAYRAIADSPRERTLTRVAAVMAVVGWVATLALHGGESMKELLLSGGRFRWAMTKAMNMWPIGVLFPLTILALALNEAKCRGVARKLSLLGDISYSSYLLHFPLQIAFLGAVVHLGMDVSVFYSPWALILFFAVLLPACFLVFRWFEMPVQSHLRRLLPKLDVQPPKGPKVSPDQD